MSELNLTQVDNASDLLAQAKESQGVPSIPVNDGQKNNKNFSRQPRKNYWKDTTIKAVPLDAIAMDQGVKAFTFAYNDREGELTDDVIEKVKRVIKPLAERGYTFRAWFNGSSTTGDKILSVATDTPLDVEWYLPTRNWNTNITKPTSSVDTELAYQIAKGLHKSYDKIPDFVRALCARDVELVLSKTCKSPIKFLLIYSPCGSETIGKNVDFKKLGQLVFLIRMCSQLNIPVFNLGKEDAIKRLQEFLTGKKEEKPAVEQTLPPKQETPPPVQEQPQVVEEPKPAPTIDVVDLSDLGI